MDERATKIKAGQITQREYSVLWSFIIYVLMKGEKRNTKSVTNIAHRKSNTKAVCTDFSKLAKSFIP